METKASVELTRRRFITIITSFSLLSSLTPSTLVFSSSDKKKILISSPSLIKGDFKFFNPYQATVIEEVTSLIIPSDRTPGAREAGVVFKIDNIVSENKRLQALYSHGIEWFDFKAKKLFGKDNFGDLTQDEKIKILNLADPSKPLSINKSNRPMVDRDNLPGVLFFDNLVSQTFNVFYTSDMGWKVVGYNGPPQWRGNLDYHKCGFK